MYVVSVKQQKTLVMQNWFQLVSNPVHWLPFHLPPPQVWKRLAQNHKCIVLAWSGPVDIICGHTNIVNIRNWKWQCWRQIGKMFLTHQVESCIPLWGMFKGPSLLLGGQRHTEDGGDHSADIYTWKSYDNSLAADGTTSTSSRLSPIQTHPVHGLWTDS